MNFISNMDKSKKDIVLEAARLSGANIEWRDEPDDKMNEYSERHKFGSLWTSEGDLSAFWRVYDRLNKSTNPGPCPD